MNDTCQGKARTVREQETEIDQGMTVQHCGARVCEACVPLREGDFACDKGTSTVTKVGRSILGGHHRLGCHCLERQLLHPLPGRP
jgi:hypothetical protein